jgi:hypothetical protein
MWARPREILDGIVGTKELAIEWIASQRAL